MNYRKDKIFESSSGIIIRILDFLPLKYVSGPHIQSTSKTFKKACQRSIRYREKDSSFFKSILNFSSHPSDFLLERIIRIIGVDHMESEDLKNLLHFVNLREEMKMKTTTFFDIFDDQLYFGSKVFAKIKRKDLMKDGRWKEIITKNMKTSEMLFLLEKTSFVIKDAELFYRLHKILTKMFSHDKKTDYLSLEEKMLLIERLYLFIVNIRNVNLQSKRKNALKRLLFWYMFMYFPSHFDFLQGLDSHVWEKKIRFIKHLFRKVDEYSSTESDDSDGITAEIMCDSFLRRYFPEKYEKEEKEEEKSKKKTTTKSRKKKRKKSLKGKKKRRGSKNKKRI